MAPTAPTPAQFEAGREFLARVRQQLAANETFLVETTLPGRTFRHVIEKAKASDFLFTIVFVYLDSVETCVARVCERVRKGGHDVAEVDIRRRYTRSFSNFWNGYRRFADEWFIIYNSGSELRRIATGQGEVYLVGEEGMFGQFLRLTGRDPNDKSHSQPRDS